jgi:hypothetical protein
VRAENEHSNGTGSGLEGTFLDIDNNGGKALLSYTAGGVVLSEHAGDLTGTNPTGGGQGTWAKTGKRTFKFSLLHLVTDQTGQFVGTQRIRANIALAADGHAYTSSNTFELFTPDGKVASSGTFTVKGTRINAASTLGVL